MVPKPGRPDIPAVTNSCIFPHSPGSGELSGSGRGPFVHCYDPDAITTIPGALSDPGQVKSAIERHRWPLMCETSL